ncbi:MAG: carboxypeptidase-like regulatory domain-containing protein [Vicingaceae bacterium]
MKKVIFSILFMSFSCLLLAGGGKTKTTAIQGTVTDNQGNPLVGAKVYVKSLKQSVYTDFDGAFVIENVPRKEQDLQLSHISFNDKKTTVDLSEPNASFLQLEMKSK